MAIANGYTTLMLREETKDLYYKTKQLIEDKVGISMTHSQCVEYMCKQMSKRAPKKPTVLSDSTN